MFSVVPQLITYCMWVTRSGNPLPPRRVFHFTLQDKNTDLISDNVSSYFCLIANNWSHHTLLIKIIAHIVSQEVILSKTGLSLITGSFIWPLPVILMRV